MNPLLPGSLAKKIVIIADLLLLAAFFILPWANHIYDVFGAKANEIATFAPILWIVPVGAILSGGIAFLAAETGRQARIKWLLILLIGVVILYPHAWITDTLGIRTLTSPNLANAAPQGKIYLPWGADDIQKLVNQYNNVLGGTPNPDYGYIISFIATVTLIIVSLGSLLQRRRITQVE